MVFASGIALLFVATGLRLEPWEGRLLLLGYVAFALLLFFRGA